MADKINLRRCIAWTFHGLIVPMLEDDEGRLYTTSKQLCAALGITERKLYRIRNNNSDWVAPIRLPDPQSNSLISRNREFLQIKRLAPDMVLWDHKTMLRIAQHADTDRTNRFFDEMFDDAIGKGKRYLLTVEQLESLTVELEQLKGSVAPIIKKFEEAIAENEVLRHNNVVLTKRVAHLEGNDDVEVSHHAARLANRRWNPVH